MPKPPQPAGNAPYELMTVTDGMAKAQLAAAQGDYDAVLRVLEPVLGLMPREAIEEPGFWQWQDLYADALVSAGRLDDADAFLRAEGKRWLPVGCIDPRSLDWRGYGGGSKLPPAGSTPPRTRSCSAWVTCSTCRSRSSVPSWSSPGGRPCVGAVSVGRPRPGCEPQRKH